MGRTKRQRPVTAGRLMAMYAHEISARTRRPIIMSRKWRPGFELFMRRCADRGLDPITVLETIFRCHPPVVCLDRFKVSWPPVQYISSDWIIKTAGQVRAAVRVEDERKPIRQDMEEALNLGSLMPEQLSDLNLAGLRYVKLTPTIRHRCRTLLQKRQKGQKHA